MKMIFGIIFSSIVIFSSISFSQDESILRLFPGKWKMEQVEGKSGDDHSKLEIFEEWKIVNGSELIGISYTINLINDEKYISENLYLKKFTDQWAYVAIPKNQVITLFPLVDFTNHKFIFENKEHDFPQKIIYEFHKDGKLTAAIEGNVNDEFKRLEFSFSIVEE